MNRKSFLKKMMLGAAGIVSGGAVIKSAQANNNIPPKTEDPLKKQVGFNHLPNKEITTMKTVLHKASTRGHANHGWLDTYHSFSFSNYYNPERMNFGVLRVLNDDAVSAGRGFGRHPHDNMEIISIPLSGDLEHQDSMGNTAIIKEGDIQVMSAGTGVYHSEKNKNSDQDVRFLQIWVYPNKNGVEPRYDQISIKDNKKPNEFQQILSPNADDDGVWIHQDAWFSMAEFDTGIIQTYHVKKEGNGVYVFVLEGDVTINEQTLNKRDGYGMWDMDSFTMTADADAKVLVMDVPMSLG